MQNQLEKKKKKKKKKNEKLMLQLLLEHSCPRLQITYFPIYYLFICQTTNFGNDLKIITMTNAIVSGEKESS